MAFVAGAEVASERTTEMIPERTAEMAPEQNAAPGGAASVEEVHVVLDRSKFVKRVTVQALRVPKGACHQLVKKLSKFKAEYPKVRNVIVEEARPETRLILLGENVSGLDLAGLPESVAAELKADRDVEITQHEVVLDYDSYTADQVLKEVLPAGAEVPSSFETIGHVAHVNLRDELLPYRRIIGEVLLEKNFPRILTVLNKVGTIENEFRVPTFEVLAGDPSTVTEVKQHSARFQLDYAQVYWNSRLEFEHSRLVDQFAREDVICDMFAGIGPFAIPAALKGCAVYANDLNPQSTHYLAINSKLNKVAHRIRVSTLDAREFVRSLVRPAESQPPPLHPPSNSPPVDGQKFNSQASAAESSQAGQQISDQGLGLATYRQDNVGPASATETTTERAQGFPAGGTESRTSGEGPNGTLEAGTASRLSREVGSSSGPGGVLPSTGGAGQNASGGSGSVPPGGKVGKGGKAAAVRPPKEPVPETPRKIDHVVMNLPASGIEFLDVFNGLFDRASWRLPLPRIHCYCFARADETDADVIRRAEEALGGAIPKPVVWNVRDVAPNKTMLCVSFTLPDDVGYSQQDTMHMQCSSDKSSDVESHENPNFSKKSRVE
ncbi:hypothetical protein KFL_003380080 [Klebsormidium nitens]|uniref:tRNA (guanine(37)-N1)-methyltransferase n=1 Tax=Klebsormidium nitens TaxID=105231 RepID=A0A1Y1I9H1_KLENI|nr:hypothetical protein KFL_003380080 [Klebsormidium nitens]|eukprot:GAQ87203.1 hypothetical protein KFL_003380080 [Klebsormidium nitens]